MAQANDLFKQLKRHPLPIAARFEHALALTYALPESALAPLIPPGLELDTWNGHAFIAVATVRTRGLRPSFLPSVFGRNFLLAGYRIFTRFRTSNGDVLRGLRIIRTDATSASMVTWGNRLTRYAYHHADMQSDRRNGTLLFSVRTPRGEADLEFSAHVAGRPAPLPPESPFPDMETAREYSAPLPLTFDYEPETNSMIVVRGRRAHWNPQPVSVDVRRNTFLTSDLFAGAPAILANAFYVEDVPYLWERGRREPVQKGSLRDSG
ncbi:MAG TPA: DUF2071 domain-containing protein [Terriglobia bacterium]|nr:DUF2071 domain-containing protein [Terriglobia bacterium]